MQRIEKYKKHKNFLDIKEYETFYEITMKSKVMNTRRTTEGMNYYNIELTKIVPESTYKINIPKPPPTAIRK